MSSATKARLFRGFLSGCARLPLPLAQFLGACLGVLYFPFARRDRRLVFRNLRIAYPTLSRHQYWLLGLTFFINLGKTVTELGAVWLWNAEQLLPLVKEVRGQQYLDDALAQGKGVMLLCPHWGNWELMGLYWSAHYGITNLYQPPEYPDIEAFIKTARERMGACLVPTDRTGVKHLLSALNQNQLIGILPDQDPGDSGGVFAPFFDQPANTMTLAGKLLRRTQAPVLFTVCERLGWGQGYRVHILPAHADIYHDQDVISATALNQGVERCVQLNPAQYIWNYNRWKRKPPQPTERKI